MLEIASKTPVYPFIQTKMNHEESENDSPNLPNLPHVLTKFEDV